MLIAVLVPNQEVAAPRSAALRVHEREIGVVDGNLVCEYVIDEERIDDMRGFEIVFKIENLEQRKIEWQNGLRIDTPLCIVAPDTSAGLCYVAVVKQGGGRSNGKTDNLGKLTVRTPTSLGKQIEIVGFETIDNEFRTTRHGVAQTAVGTSGKDEQDGSDRIRRSEIVSISPNPFNAVATINYAIKGRSRVSIRVYDCEGKRIATLVDTVQENGKYKVFWNGKNSNDIDVGSGVYFVRMESNQRIQSQKILMLR